MNCEDIVHVLDERGIASLGPKERALANAHLAVCASCASQWRAIEALQSFRSAPPPMPASLHERARELREQRLIAAAERRTRRPVLIGSLLLLGAAASLFATVPLGDANAAEQ